MDRRITFFVRDAERTSDGWLVHGERGLGPPEVDDEFFFVHHEDKNQEDRAVLRVTEAELHTLRLVTDQHVHLRKGDILGGEVER